MLPPGISERMNSILQVQTENMRTLIASTREWYSNQSLVRRILLVVGAIVGLGVGVVALIFHKYIIGMLVSLSDHWEKLKFGRLLLFSLVFVVGFPPLIGYSALSTLSGMVYGFPMGWPILASASILGSFSSFLVFRFLLRSRAEKLVQLNEKFRAFSEILKDDSSLLLLILLRLCPLPYSLSNGALAAIPELPALTFFLASLITSPKLLIHVFVGHTLKNLGDSERSLKAKMIDVLSIIITDAAALLATYIIYNKMQSKLESYHLGLSREGYDELVFGNFEEDLESGTNVELEAGDFDEDNFIIYDDEDIAEVPSSPKLDTDLDKPKAYRDY